MIHGLREPVDDARYLETLDALYRLEVARGWDLKLESVRTALERLGSPQHDFPSLHVGGTNGKGSVAAIAQSVLSARGLRVGLYTSPHLTDFCERIRIGEEWIPRAEVVALVDEVWARTAEDGLELTFFEIATVIAFLRFARENVDAAVVEVGLGGRLDATNVITPRAAAVTTISFDHEKFLGTTLAEIAAEKAGIFKPGVPAVIGRVEGEASEVLERVAAERGAPLWRLGREFSAGVEGESFEYRGGRTIRGLRCGLAGRFQIDNAVVALAALEAAGWLEDAGDDVLRRGVADVRWPGRFEVVSRRPLVVLDGAHNPAGIEALAAELPALAAGRPVHLVFGVLADKQWEPMIERIAPHVAEAVVVPVREHRSENPQRLAPYFARRVPTRTAPDAAAAIDSLRAEIGPRDEVVLVAGSLFLVGEARATLR